MKKSVLLLLVVGIIAIACFAWFARNTSREVLTAFGKMEKALETKNENVQKDNDSILNTIQDESLLTKAKEVKILTHDFTKYLESVKEEMLGIKDPTDYEHMDKPNHMFFTANGLSEKGEEFIRKMDELREKLLAYTENEVLKETIQKTLDTRDIYSQHGKRLPWLVYHFKGFPLVASITKLTQMQLDVQSLESDMFLNYIELEK